MAIKKISKTIHINAPREKVWDVMLSDATYEEWTKPFAEGSAVETDWKEGSKILFLDGKGSGMVGRITKSVRPETVVFEMDGFIADGKEDYDSPGAKEVKGETETYRFEEMDGGTHVYVETGMTEQYYDAMDQAWDKALVKVKEMAEAA